MASRKAMHGVMAAQSCDMGRWQLRTVVSLRTGYHVRIELELTDHSEDPGTAVVALTDVEAFELGYQLIHAARDAAKQNAV